jgi:hypothetical protein
VPARTAILIVNGFDRLGLWGEPLAEAEALRFPWIELCLREVARRSAGSDYEVFVWDNAHVPALRDIVSRTGARLYPSDGELAAAAMEQETSSLSKVHAASLQRLLSHVGEDSEFVITLDTDAFPVRDGWIEVLKSNLETNSLTGIWRDEMTGRMAPFVHPSCLCIRRERLLSIDQPFSFQWVQDVGQWITMDVLEMGERILPLERSNARNAHFLIGGIYGDLVYHQAAGSRRPVFRMTQGEDADAHVYEVLREAAFRDVDHLVAVLRGEDPDDLGLEWDPARPEIRREWPSDGLRVRLAQLDAGSSDG